MLCVCVLKFKHCISQDFSKEELLHGLIKTADNGVRQNIANGLSLFLGPSFNVAVKNSCYSCISCYSCTFFSYFMEFATYILLILLLVSYRTTFVTFV